MTLSAKLASYFDNKIREQGEQIYLDRLVTIKNGSAVEAIAECRGSSPCGVVLVWRKGALDAQCGCPYFDRGVCAHVWAAILAAEAQGYLSATAADEGLARIESHGHEGYAKLSGSSKLSSYSPGLFPGFVKLPAPKPPPAWRQKLAEIASRQAYLVSEVEWPMKRQIVYGVDAVASIRLEAVVLDFMTRDQKKDGAWSRPVPLNMKRSHLSRLPLAEDREILAAFEGGTDSHSYVAGYDQVPARRMLRDGMIARLMPEIIRTGRCFLKSGKPSGQEGELAPLSWDDQGAWRFGLKVEPAYQGKWRVTGFLRRGEEFMPLAAPALLAPGLVFTHGHVAPLEGASFPWIASLRQERWIEAPENEGHDLMMALLCLPGLPLLEAPEELRYEEIKLQPRPRLKVLAESSARSESERLRADVSFQYEQWVVGEHDPAVGKFESGGKRFVRRDFAAEKAAVGLLREAGAKYVKAPRSPYLIAEPSWEIAPRNMSRVIRDLVEAGWHVEAEGKFFRCPGGFRIEVASGVDWFELHGEVQYGEARAHFPALLQALREGQNLVRLDDGSYGVLPEEWLRRIAPVAGLGTPDGTHVVFRRNQAGLLDALLAARPEAVCDETFARIRQELCRFQGIQAAPQPEGFNGRLRGYQREGLGWMLFLQGYSFGGCLADDMGVGKTAQVLALLETRRAPREAGGAVGPSLAIVPRSLVFNWKEEAARFTPQLRVLDYTGMERKSSDFSGYHLVLTTYGTVRRDVLRLRDTEFDYIVLDEAQAVKNAGTESSKAVRLLRGKHRLAMSGTPVENHLGELWTLFEFLNPGMLGSASVFKMAGEAARHPDGETRRLLAQALKPFILRRTKEQVAPELPAKSEQTIYCEMEPEQRGLYNELRDHYRDVLLKRIDTDGLAKSKIQVLEALLRLRQAACHPGLIDQEHRGKPSAKTEVLLERLREIVDEGHKALVFSQFTSLLGIVRQHLDDSGIVYDYLDGRTRNRQERVERFQNDESCRLFLISLKAGGLGLNLTAAEYVFILDPWWNPAVEAQAVDRAHRIGQTKQIFAYRLIARDSVEEKVLELQQTKRDLAAAIIGEENSVIRDLRREDLELLLS